MGGLKSSYGQIISTTYDYLDQLDPNTATPIEQKVVSKKFSHAIKCCYLNVHLVIALQ